MKHKALIKDNFPNLFLVKITTKTDENGVETQYVEIVK